MTKVNKSLLLLLYYSLSAPALAMAQQRHSALDEYFHALYQNCNFNGSVLIADKGKVIFEKSYGLADFKHKKINTSNKIFPFASLTKTITATAILQLQQRGLLNIYEPVAKYLQGFPYPGITLRNLLSHTSGLPPFDAFFDSLKTAHPDTIFTNADFMHGITSNPKPLLSKPGEQFNYDNINFLILALVIEKVAHMPYRDYVKTNILTPAGMKNTRFFPFTLQLDPGVKKDVNFVMPSWYKHVYSKRPVRGDEIPYLRNYTHTYRFSGYADYIGTVQDLLKYDQALYDGRLLDRKELREAFSPVLLSDGEENRLHYGLGWAVIPDSTIGKIVYHGGNTVGFSCVLMRNTSKRQTVILYDVAHGNAPDLALNAMKIINGQKIEYPKKSIAAAYGSLLLSEGPGPTKYALQRMKKDSVHYRLEEDEMNELGYDLLGAENPFKLRVEHHYKAALEVFKMNTELFPASWNVYDSYGEALAKTGHRDDAIRMYQRSLELNPQNTGGADALKKLLTNPK